MKSELKDYKNIVLFGASSEIALELGAILLEKNIYTIGISSQANQETKYNSYLKVQDYVGSVDAVISHLKRFDNMCVIFMNGYLKENRPYEYPTAEQIRNTIQGNLTAPIYLTKKLIEENLDIKKFVYISSISSIKFRYKNYIYGISKKYLEEISSRLIPEKHLILRFGMVETRMSKNHKKAPYTLSKNKAAEIIFHNLDKTGTVSPILGLKIVSFIIKIVPSKLLDYYESRFL
jgi:short-subunit dehydrogenase